MNKAFFILCLFSAVLSLSAQTEITKKNVDTKRVKSAPKIDGILDDDAWKGADIATDFVMFRPDSGTPIPFEKRTEVRIVYDDEAIYFGAYCYDDEPDKIPKQFSSRDNFGIADWFAVAINPNNDSLNDTEFFVQVTGTQCDAKATPDGEDFSWSAVWSSATKIMENGWIVEMKIPYSTLRFSNKETQTWGLNFHRYFRNTREQYTWNFADRSVGILQQYAGTLTGIENIDPPTRLSFSPYAQSAYDSYDGEENFDASFGLDVKYGISESFTLDATLIPDFGQVAFDDLVLNLGPFEQIYQEQRPFFTEGVELFEKGNLFYTRRIGDRPINYGLSSDLEENEIFTDNTDMVNMLNAIKVSGRTNKGLGVGVFNAITEETTARIKDTLTGETREFITEPLANYSVIVFDQQFNKNSYISLTNTNVLREGSTRDANATALMWDINNKRNSFNINGGFKTSRVRENGELVKGYWFDNSFGKSSGNFNFNVGYSMADEHFDINDLGFNFFVDYQKIYSNGVYRTFEQTDTFMRLRINYFTELNYRFSNGAYMGNDSFIGFFGQLHNQMAFGGNINGNIGTQYDYYEPRVFDRYVKQAPRTNFNAWLSTNYNKKFAIDVRGFYGMQPKQDTDYYEITAEPRYRFSDRFIMIYEVELFNANNEQGYVNQLDDDTIIFGIRDRRSLTNNLSGRFNFNTKSSLNLTFRHYWSPVAYSHQFYALDENGDLTEHPYNESHDINYNVWNIDFSYAWEFAPGSQLTLLYRNRIFNADDQSQLDFGENLSNLFEQPIGHNLSLRMIYFIDYNNMKYWFKKKNS
ncbi:hypothetical protein KH5_20930 [Urechidicola sp. KH5]